MGPQHFGKVSPPTVQPMAAALLEAGRDCVGFTLARDHQIPQAGLSVAVQGLVNAAIEKADITTGDIASALGTAFASFAASQGRDRAATERMVVELADAAFRALPVAIQQRRAG